MTPPAGPIVGGWLLQRLRALGVDHLFGIPGDFILPLFEMLGAHGVHHVASCNELNAGYGADGYARLRGLGAVAVTYGPGAFSLVNATAGAYAERVPVVVISGGPARAAYAAQPHTHHVLPGRIDASVRIFEQVTVAARVLEDPRSAPAVIDDLLALCLRERRPVYLEIPVDVQTAPCPAPVAPLAIPDAPPAPQVAAAVELIASRMRAGNRTVLLAGHEIPAWGLEAQVLALAERSGVPIATLFSGKATYLEHLPQCIGPYQGAGSDPVVRAFVEAADTVLFLGAVPSDFNLGGNTARLEAAQRVHAFDGRVWSADAEYSGVPIDALVAGLLAAVPVDAARVQDLPAQSFAHVADRDYAPAAGTAISNRRLYDRLARHFRPDDVVLADAGCMINLTQVRLPRDTRYLASGYWASIGAGFGATVGACLAAPGRRVIAVEGDGSFQMTAQELSTLVRYGLAPTIVVANNRGYTAERLIHDGPFNDIQDWRYHRLAEAFGGVAGEDVHTEDDLERALARAQSHAGPGPLVIEVHLDPLDAPEAFRRMSEGLRR